MLEKQAIEKTTPKGRGFVSTVFLVPKKDGGQKPVINLKSLNRFVHTEHFKMEGIQTCAKSRRLDGESGPQRCIFHASSSRRGQGIPQVLVPRSNVSI